MTEFTDPRLLAVYETLNQYDPGTQPDFYAALASSVGARSIVDIGCGTGLITRDLARRGYRMTGLDPAPGMLDIARRRPYGDRVDWITGEVTTPGRLNADLAIMSGHVPQFFLTDSSWASALSSVAGVLKPGGWLAFESRDPADRAWERWTSARRSSAVDPHYGRIDFWTEVTEVRGPVVAYELHYRFGAEEIVAPGTLRWRTRAELTASLTEAGFTVAHTYGTWDHHPTGPELIIVAQREDPLLPHS